MPDDVKISALSQVSSLDSSDVFPVVHELNGEPTTMKATMAQVGEEVNKDLQYISDLQTTSKTVIGAINELKGSQGSATLVGLQDTNISSPTDGQVLKYDGASSKWVNGKGTEIIGHAGPASVCSFETDVADNLVSVKCTIVASGGGGTPSTPIPIVGHSAVNLMHNGTTDTIALGSTVYGGELDVTSGVLKDTGYLKDSFVYGETALIAINQYGIANFGIVIPTPFVFADGAIANCLERQYTSGSDTQTEGFFINASNELYVRLNSTRASTVEEFLTWANANLKILFTRQTAIETQLTPTQVQAILGDNNVFCDTGETEVEYLASGAGEVKQVIEQSTIDELEGIPTLPNSDGAYKLVCTISSGVPTFTWESNS